MAETTGSSPLSEISEPVAPPEASVKPAIEVSSVSPHLPSSSAPSASTPTAPVPAVSNSSTTAPSPKKAASKSRRKPSAKSLAAGGTGIAIVEEPCPACEKLDARSRKANSKIGTVWVECDQCETWYHWSCVSTNPKDSPESLDKWYCTPCLTASLSTPNPLTISYKLTSSIPIASTSTAPASTRKSGRAAERIDYSNLNEHLPASVDRWSNVISARTASGQIKPDTFRRMRPEEITMDWVYGENGMLEPFVVEKPEGLGMSMPRRDISVGEIAELIGPETPLEVIDCASQSSLAHWTLRQWAEYYQSPDRDKVRNVISLEVSETRLGKMVVAPELVRKLDWVDNVWPEDMKLPGQYPRVQKYCLMSVARCWTDWHVDFAGSSVFYHILKGGKTFYFIRPTPANLAAYERWSGSTERQEQEWLGDSCDEVLKIELKEGNTAFLPTGWIHAVYTPADSIVIGGNFLHSLNIPTQLRIYEIELATKVPKKFRYPHFVKLLWLVANHYQALLTSLPLPPSQTSPLPPNLSPRVLEGLFALSSFLINQTTRFLKSPTISPERRRIARENVPWNKVSDPVKLSREFRKNVLRAMGRELDEDCFKPHGVEEEDATVSNVAAPTNGKKGSGAGLKRKGTDESSPAPTKSAKVKHPTNAGSPPPPGSALANQGEIISRHAVPVPPTTRFEPRVDPKKLELGARLAEIRETRNSQMVARRWEEKGETFVEMRTVHTIIERVKWSDAIKQEEQPQPSHYGYVPGSQPPHNAYYPPPPIMNAQSYPPQMNNSPQPPVYPYPYPQPQSFAQQQPPFYHYPPQPPHMNGNHPPPQGQQYAYPAQYSIPPQYPSIDSQQPSSATKSPSINSLLNGTPSQPPVLSSNGAPV